LLQPRLSAVLVDFDCQGIPYCVLKGPVNFKWFACDCNFLWITRLSAVLGDPPPRGRARGIAIRESFGSVVGEVVEMSMQDGGRSAHRASRELPAGVGVPGLPPIARTPRALRDRDSAPRLDFTDCFGVLAVAPFALRDLLSVHRDFARRLDADSDLRSVHRHDGDFNVVADTQRLTGSSGQYQHRFASLLAAVGNGLPGHSSSAGPPTM
jgi:hypothetical protein